MVKRNGTYPVVNEKNLKGGDGIIEIHNFFEKEDFYGMGRLFGICIIQPGDSIGWHQHVGEQEAYYILEGEACYNDNGNEIILKPGDFSICRDGEYHAINCWGQQPLRYIAFIMYTNKG